MKKLVLGSLVITAVSQTAGCVITTDDPVITAAVTITSENGQPFGCNGDDAIRINAKLAGTSSGEINLFDCDASFVVTNPIPPGDYDVWIDYINGQETAAIGDDLVIATSTVLPVILDLDLDVSLTLALPTGAFDVAWRLLGNGVEAACSQVPGENGVAVTATLAGSTDGTESLFDCEAGAAGVTTDPVNHGPHVVVLSLLDAEDLSLGDSADFNAEAMGGFAVDIGTIDIILD